MWHDAAMGHPYWPLFDLRLTSGDVTLRSMTESDLIPLARIQPADLETNPHLPVLTDDPAMRHAQTVFQSYWSYVGSWRLDSWRLPFTVEVGGEMAGWQEIEAAEFGRRRTVETASWLATAWQGRGVGKAMRLAVLALAFDGLGALAAETEAWHDNAASIGVSRALGYTDNGTTLHVRGEGADEMPRLRMTRDQWTARHSGHRVSIDGLHGCRPYFGV
jgi:RimJ/RimL family protein N-acetyltransferase